ncbi:hypothetical protein BO71DRAFT_110449 [Aspergillus ellipticus CBS 707.79]|uniref:Uncharacterized protein n=1 Tax=Aspergillus ellipticus CBS 707.79 TaxID=1448320 RepID=A0A319CXC1_9EURO|nr:hypothetical protein BO71DRAFT_110449 [Aspergillus ellipticus CBS 707.79]
MAEPLPTPDGRIVIRIPSGYTYSPGLTRERRQKAKGDTPTPQNRTAGILLFLTQGLQDSSAPVPSLEIIIWRRRLAGWIVSAGPEKKVEESHQPWRILIVTVDLARPLLSLSQTRLLYYLIVLVPAIFLPSCVAHPLLPPSRHLMRLPGVVLSFSRPIHMSPENR